MTGSTSLEATLKVAADVVETLRAQGADAVVIGAVALAVHGYPRDTEDFDLAVAVEPPVLRRVASTLAGRGYSGSRTWAIRSAGSWT